jgi:hypothetical protein
MSRRFELREPCLVPSCSRGRKKEVPFCVRCWALCQDGEQVQARFAMEAPFWRRYDSAGWAPGDAVVDGVALELRYGNPVYVAPGSTPENRNEMYFGYLLHEYEQRSTLTALAELLKLRRYNQSEPAEPAFVEGEDP